MDGNNYKFNRDFLRAAQGIVKQLAKLVELVEAQNELIGIQDELIDYCPGCDCETDREREYIKPDETMRVLEDLSDRICAKRELPFIMRFEGLSELIDWLRSFYPELYTKLKDEDD